MRSVGQAAAQWEGPVEHPQEQLNQWPVGPCRPLYATSSPIIAAGADLLGYSKGKVPQREDKRVKVPLDSLAVSALVPYQCPVASIGLQLTPVNGRPNDGGVHALPSISLVTKSLISQTGPPPLFVRLCDPEAGLIGIGGARCHCSSF